MGTQHQTNFFAQQALTLSRVYRSQRKNSTTTPLITGCSISSSKPGTSQESLGSSSVEIPEWRFWRGEQTPLNIAVRLGLPPLVEKALSDFPKGTNSYQSPLHLAARFISGAYKVLIAKGGSSLLTDLDKNGNTPLHEAAISGHSSMLKALVKKFREHKAYSNEINKKNHLGNTPLHLAFQFDHMEIVELLVKQGGDATTKNNAQMTTLELGAKLERGDSLDILQHVEEIREESKKNVLELHVDEHVGDTIEYLPWSLFADSLQSPPKPKLLSPLEDSLQNVQDLPTPRLLNIPNNQHSGGEAWWKTGCRACRTHKNPSRHPRRAFWKSRGGTCGIACGGASGGLYCWKLGCSSRAYIPMRA